MVAVVLAGLVISAMFAWVVSVRIHVFQTVQDENVETMVAVVLAGLVTQGRIVATVLVYKPQQRLVGLGGSIGCVIHSCVIAKEPAKVWLTRTAIMPVFPPMSPAQRTRIRPSLIVSMLIQTAPETAGKSTEVV
jgi:hypothetical protein